MELLQLVGGDGGDLPGFHDLVGIVQKILEDVRELGGYGPAGFGSKIVDPPVFEKFADNIHRWCIVGICCFYGLTNFDVCLAECSLEEPRLVL